MLILIIRLCVRKFSTFFCNICVGNQNENIISLNDFWENSINYDDKHLLLFSTKEGAANLMII